MKESEYIDLIGKKGLKTVLTDAFNALLLLPKDLKKANREMNRAFRHSKHYLNELLNEFRGVKA